MPVDELDEQVVAILSNLTIPDGFRERVETAVPGRVENETTLRTMEEIRAMIERIDLRWDRGYISQEEYIEKSEQLEREMEGLHPIDYHELMEAADLIEHCRAYWDLWAQFDNPAEARQQLLAKIVERVFVNDARVLVLVLRG